MEVSYDDSKVETLFDNFNLMVKKIGASVTKSIKKRYEQLRAAETFHDFLTTGLGKPHLLKGNKSDCYGISVTGNVRLLVKPIAVDFSAEALRKCTKVIIKGVEDYHGDKVTTYIP